MKLFLLLFQVSQQSIFSKAFAVNNISQVVLIQFMDSMSMTNHHHTPIYRPTFHLVAESEVLL